MRRMIRLHLGVTALFLCVVPTARAQSTPAAPWITDTITSATLHEQRTLLVALPTGYQAGSDSFPVLVLLDAEDRPQFEAAVANVKFLASRSEIPGLIIVGLINGRDRMHDMSPAITGSMARYYETAGGAVAFEDFLAGEVLPYIRGQYRTRHQTILAGHSLGSLFALDVAATMKNPYLGFIAMSPSLWWNDSTVARDYADGIARLTTGQRFFVTSGAFERPIDRPAQWFIARLDSLQPHGISYAYHRYPDDTHQLTPQPSLIAGLRYVFQPVSVARLPLSQVSFSWDSAQLVQAVTASESEYAHGARALGLPETLPEPVLNQLGYGVLQVLDLPKVATWLFQQNVSNYPASANAHDSYGDGLVAAGDTTAAIAQYQHAVMLWEARHDPLAAMSRAKLERLEKSGQGGKGKPGN